MKPATQEKSTLYVSMELSDSRWRLAMRGSGGAKVRRRAIEAEDLEGLLREVGVAKELLGAGAEAEVVSCYEAGRYGFALHRVLTGRGWRNHVVHPASVRVSRQGRRAKTDRLDADLLLRSLVRYEQGERGEWTTVRIPSEKAEDEREFQRELDSLRSAGNRERNQIQGLLMKCLGKKVEVEEVQKRGLTRLRALSGGVVPVHLLSRLERTLARLKAIEEQTRAILKARRERLREASKKLEAGEPIDPLLAKVLRLESLRCVGEQSAWLLTTELFSWRDLRNRRQVGRLAGLTGTPYDSGQSQREQGIDKAGNRRVRRLMVEISWLWLRYQPRSKLTLWYYERFVAVRRHRRVGIVALARKLLIALWRFCDQGVIPEGAVLKL